MRAESGVAPGAVSLPSGGGGIAPLGDRFQPDLVRGSGSYAVSISLPKGPNELQPSMALTYSTGSGNGPFGQGWQLGVARIERRTDRGIPSYTDEDEFALGGAELLVPVGGPFYRLRDDSRFWQIERLGDNGGNGWRIRTGDGHTLLFGQSEASREAGPGGVFAWCLDEERDCAGNAVTYRYRRDGEVLFLEELRYSIFSVRIGYEPRPDVLRHGRTGALRRIALRAKSIDLHCDSIPAEPMRTYRLSYEQAANGVSLLRKVRLTAGEGESQAAFPELTFGYSAIDINHWSIEELRSPLPPPRLGEPTTQLVDLTGDGLADVLHTGDGRALMWRNAGDGTLEGPFPLPGVPSVLSLARGNVALADLDGNGRVELFAVDQPLRIAYEADAVGGFQDAPTVFRHTPHLRLAAPDTRLTDFNGDGATDLMTTGRQHLLLYRHEPGVGWDDPIAIRRINDLDAFPDVSFEDLGVRLADMSGDGLQDFTVVRSGEVSYWPHTGNGNTTGRLSMANPPVFPSGYRDDRVHLVDVDGDGCADVVYLDHDRTIVWLNRSGNGFAPPIEIPVAPATSMRPLAGDLFGDGRPGFAWDGAPSTVDGTGYKVLRFDPGRTPYLLETVDNGMGGLIEISYSTSTQMRVRDRAEGADWLGELPFVVHLVSAIAERDTVTGVVTTKTMHYHDGVFDGPQRTFRGFKRVTVEMAGDESVPGSVQEVTFFQGDPEHPDLVTRERQRARAGTMLETRSFERTGDGLRLHAHSRQTWDVRLEYDGAGGRVFFPHVTEIEARELSPTGQPAKVERSRLLDFDAYGNPGRKTRESFPEGTAEGSSDVIRREERFTYLANETEWLVKLPVRAEMRDGDGVPWSVQIRYYDGDPFTGLPEGQATHGMPTRVQELRMLNSRIPAGYLDGRDPAVLGLQQLGSGDTAGWYVTTMAVRRDAKGNVVQQRDPSGVPLEVFYDENDLYPVRSRDASGGETRLTFEPRSGEPLRMELPDGRVIRHEYDPIGRLSALYETDDGGAEQLVKAWRLDLSTRPASMTSIVPAVPGLNTASFGGDLALVDNAAVCRAYFDGFGRQLLKVATAPDAADGSRRFAATESVELNPKGMVKVFHPPRFVPDLAFSPPPAATPAATRQRYDVAGNVTETLGPGATHFRAVRDNFTITHFVGAATTPSRTETFDALGRLLRVDEAGVVTGYEVNVEGKVSRLLDGNGKQVAAYGYAGPGAPIWISHRDAGTRTYYRDAGGKTVEQVNADGGHLVHHHDAVGRIVRMSHNGMVFRELAYDIEGRIEVAREGGHELRYAYNKAGKVIRESVTTDGVTLTTQREYDLQGRNVAIVYPDASRVEYHLDRSGSVRAIPGAVSNVVYAADGGVQSYRLHNGVTVEMPREAESGRLQYIQAGKDGFTLRRLDYGYDAVGAISSLRDEEPGLVEQQSFTYDALYRLTGFEVRQGTTVVRGGSYVYDDTGNLLSFGDNGSALVMSYEDAARPGRLTRAGGNPVGYDGRGHISSFGNLAAIEFDPLERMSRAVTRDGAQIGIAYDPQSRRILKTVVQGGQTRTVRYAAGLFEHHATHVLRHIYLGKLLIASVKVDGGSAAPAYFVCDHHGTVLLATDATGTPIAQQRYTPFGAALRQSVELDRYLGRDRDPETGLQHLGARYYAPALGRFISVDWYVLENPGRPARMPQAYNVYSYALNNPLVFKDPSGMFIPLIVGAIIAIAYIAAVATVAALAVGFVAGLIYGLANGQGWGSLLTALETALTTTAGMWLGGITGFFAGLLVGNPFGGFIVGAAMGGMNGLISGMTGIYDWSSWKGWAAFASDSTWGLVGTSLGNIVHVINLFYGDANYRSDLSRRQNRHVYEGGFALKSDFAFTQGNVISNAGQGGKGINASFIAQHEELHIWQNRIFGPLFQLTYVVWAVGGFIVGTAVWFTDTDEDWGSLVETAAYYDNPFEYWAYKNDSNWPPSGANSKLTW